MGASRWIAHHDVAKVAYNVLVSYLAHFRFTRVERRDMMGKLVHEYLTTNESTAGRHGPGCRMVRIKLKAVNARLVVT